MVNLAIVSVIVVAAVGVKMTFELPVVKITLRSLDEQGKPVEGAEGYLPFETSMPSWGGGAVVPAKGLTNAKGEFSGEGHSFDTQGGRLSKEGYYASDSQSSRFQKSAFGKWKPWNPTVDVVLKKIVNPIPMYAKSVRIGIPKVEIPLGYDLIIGDWVEPNGRGTASDLLITANLDQRGERDYDYKLTIAFSNKGDGIQTFQGDTSSRLKSPRTAPGEGYQPEWVQTRTLKPSGPEVTNWDEKRNYFFRVRTVLDAKGDVVSAHYGKIYGDFMTFTYYLNPTPNDRNLEFDPKRNLMAGVPENEKVNDP